MNTLQIHEIGFRHTPGKHEKGGFCHGTKTETGFQIGETIRSLRMERKTDARTRWFSKLQLMDLDITRSIYSQIEGGTYSIRISVLAGLAQIFQVDYNTFFRDVHLPGSE